MIHARDVIKISFEDVCETNPTYNENGRKFNNFQLIFRSLGQKQIFRLQQILKDFNPHCQILEDLSKNFLKIFIFQVMTQCVYT